MCALLKMHTRPRTYILTLHPARGLDSQYLKSTRKCTSAECHAWTSSFCARVEHIYHGNTHAPTKSRGMCLVHLFDIFCVYILRPHVDYVLVIIISSAGRVLY